MAKTKQEPLPQMAYRVKSTGEEFQLVELRRLEGGKRLSRPIYFFKYLNRQNKAKIRTYIEEIERALKLEVWERIPVVYVS